MAYYDTKHEQIVDFPDRPYPNYPGWALIDCGCCAGIQWGGDHPVECDICGGNGYLAKHLDSGVLADYPGGPLRGREES